MSSLAWFDDLAAASARITIGMGVDLAALTIAEMWCIGGFLWGAT